MSAMAARVPHVEPGTRPELAALEQRIAAERGRISPLYQVLLNSAPIAAGWERMLTAVRNQTRIDPALRELVILRVAVLNHARFEFDAHRPIAERAGVTTSQLDAVTQVPPPPGVFSALEAQVLELTDRMTRDVDVPDAVIAPLLAQFDAGWIVELVATVAAYNMVSRVLVALKIEH